MNVLSFFNFLYGDFKRSEGCSSFCRHFITKYGEKRVGHRVFSWGVKEIIAQMQEIKLCFKLPVMLH